MRRKCVSENDRLMLTYHKSGYQKTQTTYLNEYHLILLDDVDVDDDDDDDEFILAYVRYI